MSALLERSIDAVEIRNAKLPDFEVAEPEQAMLKNDGRHVAADYTMRRLDVLRGTTSLMKSLAFMLVLLGLNESLRAEKFTDLGVQITSSTIQGTTFTKEPDGREVVCTVDATVLLATRPEKSAPGP